MEGAARQKRSNQRGTQTHTRQMAPQTSADATTRQTWCRDVSTVTSLAMTELNQRQRRHHIARIVATSLAQGLRGTQRTQPPQNRRYNITA
jgi:hypothetical protein